MDSFELEIKMGFLEEAKEMLANAEQCFLNLEKAKDDPSIIEEIFRVAHNFKGSAGAVGFNDLKDFDLPPKNWPMATSHVVEQEREQEYGKSKIYDRTIDHEVKRI